MLEEPTKKLAQANLKAGARIVEIGTEVLPESRVDLRLLLPQGGGQAQPPPVDRPDLRQEVRRRDPPRAHGQRTTANAAGYQSNYDAFADLIDEFDSAMRTSFATLPREKRKLLTYHDAYAYFAKTYDWTVIGAIQVENFEDPSPKEVAELIDQVKASKVPAIFGSEVFPSPVLAQIGKEAGRQLRRRAPGRRPARRAR